MAVANTTYRKGEQLCRVLDIQWLTDSVYLLRFERNDTVFIPGQYLTISRADCLNAREYSIYSGKNDNYFEVLIKAVPDGVVSQQLKEVKSGNLLRVGGPHGNFCLPAQAPENFRYLFIATGTGIAPIHSIVRSYPKLDYTLLHGVSFAHEAYGAEDFDAQRHILCTSKDNGKFRGRVTHYLETMDVPLDTLCYLSGNSQMIFEAYGILRKKHIPVKQIFTEVYF
ncbi:MAG TPA: FAD-dependent oxidoreductase [Bacteroidales bacterium]|mgnify:CR=1 FL=1|nr:FAD-dependent oxidoreductase [Bacteroidales bacterium]HOK98665.1 FAD-dependent oxidoreductase [Bacteroidales bacterium]HPO65067.1 FAD-dependent oxidoreductase [Bacteroidales bacterium]